MAKDHERFMRIAIAEAKAGYAMGEQPFGAVVAQDGAVVVRARSLKVSESDTTAHAETLAIKHATKKLRSRIITGCTFYATCEPCPMCLGAVFNAGIDRLVLGARNRHLQQAADLAFHFNEYSVENFARMVGWDLELIEGVLTDECVDMYAKSRVELTR